jgi:hypothetical protein
MLAYDTPCYKHSNTRNEVWGNESWIVVGRRSTESFSISVDKQITYFQFRPRNPHRMNGTSQKVPFDQKLPYRMLKDMLQKKKKQSL